MPARKSLFGLTIFAILLSTLAPATAADGVPTITSAKTFGRPAGTTIIDKLTADQTVIWTITGGKHAALFSLDPSGILAFKAPAQEGIFGVQVAAVNSVGKVGFADIAVTISGITGGSGSGEVTPKEPDAFQITSPVTFGRPEGILVIDKLRASETVIWTITGGKNAALFSLTNDGVLAFKAPAREGIYGLQIGAVNSAGKVVLANLAVTISGITGGSDDAVVEPLSITSPSTFARLTGNTSIGRLTATLPVTWAIVGGTNQALFALATDGTLSFRAAPSAGTFLVEVSAATATNETVRQLITVTVTSDAAAQLQNNQLLTAIGEVFLAKPVATAGVTISAVWNGRTISLKAPAGMLKSGSVVSLSQPTPAMSASLLSILGVKKQSNLIALGVNFAKPLNATSLMQVTVSANFTPKQVFLLNRGGTLSGVRYSFASGKAKVEFRDQGFLLLSP